LIESQRGDLRIEADLERGRDTVRQWDDSARSFEVASRVLVTQLKLLGLGTSDRQTDAPRVVGAEQQLAAPIQARRAAAAERGGAAFSQRSHAHLGVRQWSTDLVAEHGAQLEAITDRASFDTEGGPTRDLEGRWSALDRGR
jgi:hypothetical protein